MITLTVNGEPKEVQPTTSLKDIVSLITPASRGVAVAVNAAVIPKSTWETTQLAAGDEIEILTAAPGG